MDELTAETFPGTANGEAPILVVVWRDDGRERTPDRIVMLERLAADGALPVLEVDAAEQDGLVARLGVGATPAMLILRNGAVVARHHGVPEPSAARDWLDEALARPASA